MELIYHIKLRILWKTGNLKLSHLETEAKVSDTSGHNHKSFLWILAQHVSLLATYFSLDFDLQMRATWKLCASESDHPKQESFQCRPVAFFKSQVKGWKFELIWWFLILTQKLGDKFHVKMSQCAYPFQNAGYINLELKKLTSLWANLPLERLT